MNEPQENKSDSYDIFIYLSSSLLKKDVDLIDKMYGKINGGVSLRG